MLAIALLLALVAMLFEAIAWAGLDNLVLPLVGYLLLRIYLGLSLEELELRLAVAGGMMVFVLACRTQTTLVGSALLGASLVGYLSWALGGWRWIIPPLTVFLGHTLLSPRTTANSQRIHNIHSVIAVSAAGLFWLFIFRLFDQPESAYFCLFDQPESAYFCLFTLSFAVQMGMIAVARLGYDYPRLPAVWLLGICVLQGWGLIMLPYLALALSEPHAIACVAWGLAGVTLATVGFYFLQPNVRDCPADQPRWLRQATLGALGSAVGLVPLYLL